VTAFDVSTLTHLSPRAQKVLADILDKLPAIQHLPWQIESHSMSGGGIRTLNDVRGWVCPVCAIVNTVHNVDRFDLDAGTAWAYFTGKWDETNNQPSNEWSTDDINGVVAFIGSADRSFSCNPALRQYLLDTFGLKEPA